ncbi:hypothetical protein GV794_08500 [Nocardia cyriacigeorgica]|uniref:Lipoprotein n=1 Tax=Nocardia cyriacigeorgica TaxID=135487 RepID=A0A6P1DAM5_9NOCA|nr:hypothetical protein [Nocardia cyriacigeorgica]NEW40839.1 hypothetical protein [Nocardia cyriacigeorgica]NEW45920.1 hypothetical protein [Nocardia cyriacigeorgica]NEW50951.1 hypothetical protein [Nocardia cyriacigeorgica]NEW55691.1 hypothetical protein [Nocardia cyriacigeorgica]
MRRFERTSLAAASVAITGGIVLVSACSNSVSGTAQVNQSDLATYTSMAAASSSAAAATAATAACDTFSTANGDSVRKFNAYIDASNNDAPDTAAKASDAETSLRDGANDVDRKLAKNLPPGVAQALRDYRDDSKKLADLLEQDAPTDIMNDHIDVFNATKDAAVDACEDYE